MSDIELLYFSASWCGPCRSMPPVISALREAGYKVTKIDVDEDRATTQQFAVMAMPTFIFLRNGQQVKRIVGARSKDSLLAEFWNAENS